MNLRNIKLWVLVIIVISVLSLSFTACAGQKRSVNKNSSLKYVDGNFKYAISKKVNTLSHIYGDIAWMLKRIADGKMTIKEFEYYNYGVNRFIQDNNFRMIETLLFEDSNDRLYQLLVDINIPIINAKTIVKNVAKDELYDIAQIYSDLRELTDGNNKKSLSYYILNYDEINGQKITQAVNEIEARVRQLNELIESMSK
ncbi:MAG: hypothetical protein H0Z35_09745 [Thermoanaerobacteraceae bacterium]|nr:hypothetical protein [Thermoanaerobacteraceae bacterium]